MEVLTINKDYFRLRKPIERRMYELARKHCGQSVKWEIGLDKLIKKTGSSSRRKEFRRMLKPLMQSNHLPDYRIELSGDDKVTFRKRKNAVIKDITPLPRLMPDDYERAKKVAPGWDVYALEYEFIQWIEGKEKPKNMQAAFVGFCKQKYQKAAA